MTIQCCVCKKVKEGENWKLDGHGGRSEASHTYCPRCLKSTVAEIRGQRRQAVLAQPAGA